MGHLTRDAEMKATPSGSVVTNFSIATSFGTGDNKKSEFHNIVIWNTQTFPAAENAGKLKKGDLVFVNGRMQTRSWEKDGVKRYATDVVANRVDWLRSPNSNPQTQPEDEFGESQIDMKDVPF